MPKLTLLGAFSVLHNNILGPGVLGLPWAVAQGGLGLGSALLVLSAATGFLGMQFLAASAVHVQGRLTKGETLTMATACRIVDARELRFAMEVGLVLACGGALITSLIIIGDTLEPLGYATRAQWIIGVFLAVPFPLSFFSQISFLRLSSYLSFTMMLYLAVMMYMRTTDGTCPDNPTHWFRLDNIQKIFQTVPIFTFCFCGHMSIFSIARELEDATAKRLNTVIFIATVSAALIFGIVASSAVSCFGDLTPQDLLDNQPKSVKVTVARIGMAIVCCGFFPLLVQPVRTTCLGWLESGMALGFQRQMTPSSLATPLVYSPGGTETTVAELERRASVKKGYDKATTHVLAITYQVITILIGSVSLGVALATSSLGMVFSLSGATGFALLCNICPPWLYLVVCPRDKEKGLRVAAWVLLVFGVIMMPICIIANFMAALPHQESHTCILPASCDATAFCKQPPN